MTKLTSAQFDDVVEQYAEIVCNRMDTAELEAYVMEDLMDRYGMMSEVELREHIIEVENSGCPEDNLFDELVDNVTPVHTYGLEEGESLSFPVHSDT